MNPKKIFQNIGPGPIITAAFIGPGTVTVCTLAGIQFDYNLLWALVLSIIATLFLQEISGRLGIITRKDLGELIRNQTGNPLFKWTSLILILIAIGIGNAAYQGGNISGANLGLGIFWEAPIWTLGSLKIQSGNLVIGFLAFFLLWSGNYKRIEQTLIALVILMSLSFLTTAVLIHPDWTAVVQGFTPSFSDTKFPTIVALIGTTVVPYNLFLYASLVKKQWQSSSDLAHMRKDIGLSVILGGLVSMAIVIVGVANPSESLNSAQDIAKGLSGVFGDFGTYLMGFGLLAAGLTSSLTAPLAGGLVICGLLGWNQDIRSKSMRGVIGTILLLGIIFSSFGIRPVTLITLAQLANGILLPIISAWLIWAGSQKLFLGNFVSKSWSLIFGILIWTLTFILGIKSIWTVIGFTV